MRIPALSVALAAATQLSFIISASAEISMQMQQMRLLAAGSRDSVLSLTTDEYNQLVDIPERDYAVVALMTVVSDNYQCEPCRTLDPNFRKVAYSWRQKEASLTAAELDATAPIFFVNLDFTVAKDIFAKYKVSQVPYMLYHYPKMGKHAKESEPDNFDFNAQGLTAASLLLFIQARVQHQFPLVEPFDMSKLMGRIALVVGSISAVVAAAPILLRIIVSRRIWSALAISTCLLMTSGFMWNRIRNPEFIGRGPGGSPIWISGGAQYQFAVETQIVAGLYALCAFAVVLLTVEAPKVKNVLAQRLVVLMGMAIFAIGYSVVLAIFKHKANHYPYKLLF